MLSLVTGAADRYSKSAASQVLPAAYDTFVSCGMHCWETLTVWWHSGEVRLTWRVLLDQFWPMAFVAVGNL